MKKGDYTLSPPQFSTMSIRLMNKYWGEAREQGIVRDITQSCKICQTRDIPFSWE
ncbi:hypothetical protein MC7420_284 [Coleofasciculus chthonoplastes PCC 7420]|uniref:Uncharacterized protein n=1 Tax=Coleofasciculus chthonoplastes PCC 7420 TaxID=118168 RepID=B4VLQ4_9CYAN|nr:hypothetical protein MC7420_284 [Coleofasciculus chthonoplastes PCC 7420]